MTAEPHSPAHQLQTIDMWFDPVCPFTWATSRWLLDVVSRRPMPIRWHLMSLAILNEGQNLEPEVEREMAESTAAGRLLAAVAQAHGNAMLGAAYTNLGKRLHGPAADAAETASALDRGVAEAVLAECGADPALAAALEDPAYDEQVRRSHAEGQDALGETGGSPVTAFDGATFFGPVFTSIPCGEEGLEIFDAVATLAASGSFSQLQRHRSGPPDLGWAAS